MPVEHGGTRGSWTPGILAPGYHNRSRNVAIVYPGNQHCAERRTACRVNITVYSMREDSEVYSRGTKVLSWMILEWTCSTRYSSHTRILKKLMETQHKHKPERMARQRTPVVAAMHC